MTVQDLIDEIIHYMKTGEYNDPADKIPSVLPLSVNKHMENELELYAPIRRDYKTGREFISHREAGYAKSIAMANVDRTAKSNSTEHALCPVVRFAKIKITVVDVFKIKFAGQVSGEEYDSREKAEEAALKLLYTYPNKTVEVLDSSNSVLTTFSLEFKRIEKRI